ncbi:MAG: ribosome maturation factor RimM [Coriobacteriales bacterium]|nr:ribosome maturation factor RimM [Coriobacteriales bacterium]
MASNTSDFEFCKVAKILKTHQLKGDVSCFVLQDAPPFLLTSLKYYLVPPIDEKTRYLTINAIQNFDGCQAVFKFNEISDVQTASQICGHFLLAKKSDFDENYNFDLDHTNNLNQDELIDFELIDERFGCLGYVSEIIYTMANAVLVCIDQNNKEVLIPFVDEYIVEIDDEVKKIYTKLIDGLV